MKLRGKVRGAGNVMSYFHRVPCIAHRMVTTTHEGSRYVGNTVVHTYRISKEWQLMLFCSVASAVVGGLAALRVASAMR